jgi:hypothetical protein
MTLVTLTASAQYPTTKNIKGTQVVIMTVPQAEAIDNKFIQLKDSVGLLNKSLYQSKEILKTTNETLSKTNLDLNKSQGELKQSLLLNETYLKEIERYKKMEFEDRQVKKRVTIGVVSALAVWIAIFIGSVK